jgi:poly-gamma-glutamate capsule biosynthesis protein CapA/YwtB (metallophosphatase superfamily)
MRRLVFPTLALILLAACTGTSAPSAPRPTPTQAPSIALRVATATPTPLPFTAPEAVPPLTLDDVFGSSEGRAALKLDPAKLRTIVATGDVIPARNVDNQIRLRGNDFAYPLSATSGILRQADLTVVNLEAPLIQDCPPHDEGFVFCGQPGFAQALADGGVDVATLENNHIGNYGQEGIDATKDLLTATGIAWADAFTPTVLEVRGLRVAFVAFNGVGGSFDRELIGRQIAAAREDADVVVAAFHWGAEYVTIPQAAPGIANDSPVEIAHLAVDAGADLVIGNHPHWVQALEVYKDKLIAYAHGNFIADQMWSRETTIGVIGRYTFYGTKLVGAEFLPVIIENYARPRPLGGPEAQAVLDGMRQASAGLREQTERPSPNPG